MNLFKNNNTAFFVFANIQIKKEFVYLNTSEKLSGILFYQNNFTKKVNQHFIDSVSNLKNLRLNLNGGSDHQVIIVLKRMNTRRVLPNKRLLENTLPENKLYVSIVELNDDGSPKTETKKKTNIPGIIGGVFAGIFILCCCCGQKKISSKTK